MTKMFVEQPELHRGVKWEGSVICLTQLNASTAAAASRFIQGKGLLLEKNEKNHHKSEMFVRNFLELFTKRLSPRAYFWFEFGSPPCFFDKILANPKKKIPLA